MVFAAIVPTAFLKIVQHRQPITLNGVSIDTLVHAMRPLQHHGHRPELYAAGDVIALMPIRIALCQGEPLSQPVRQRRFDPVVGFRQGRLTQHSVSRGKFLAWTG